MMRFFLTPTRKMGIILGVTGLILAAEANVAAAAVDMNVLVENIPEAVANPVPDAAGQENPAGEKASQGKEDVPEPVIAEKDPTAATAVPAQPEQRPSKGFVEAGEQRYVLTGNEPNWTGTYLRGAWIQDEKNVWNYEVVNAHRFDDNGTFFSGSLTHTFNEDWYGSLAIGGSTGAVFFPRYRVDVFLHRKLLEKRNLVATIGYTDYQAEDVHRDRILHLGADYYFESPWIVSGEFTVNNSSPGNVKANYAYLAATYGHDKDSYLTLRLGHGKEAYQLLGDEQVISGFYSSIATMTYRKWIGRDWGFNLVGEYYTNPLYKRRGIELGFFKDL